MFPAPLPDLDGLDPEAVKALLIAKHNESIEQHKQLRSNSKEIEHLKLLIEKYRRMIFGRKSEKLTRELEQLELRLEELETTQAADQAAEAEAQQPSSPQPDSKPRTSRPRVANAIDEPTAAAETATEAATPASAPPDTRSGNQEITSAAADQSSSTADQAASFGRTRVSAREMSALKTFGVVPTYPPIARAARVEGTVLFDAIISEDGSVKSLTIISGPAMLQQPTLDAVRTWKYSPYLVNGAPREVETNIEVVFKLGD